MDDEPKTAIEGLPTLIKLMKKATGAEVPAIYHTMKNHPDLFAHIINRKQPTIEFLKMMAKVDTTYSVLHELISVRHSVRSLTVVTNSLSDGNRVSKAILLLRGPSYQ